MPFSFDVSISLLGTMFIRFYAFHDFHGISMPFFGLVSVLILFGTAHGLAAGRLRRAELSTNASQKRVQSLRRCRPPADSIEWEGDMFHVPIWNPKRLSLLPESHAALAPWQVRSPVSLQVPSSVVIF